MTGATGAGVRVTESFGAVLQDLGRAGHEKGGVSRSGASDTFSSRFANIAVGNEPGAPCVEVTGSAFAFDADMPVIVAVTGARSTVWVDGDVRVPQWEPVTVPAGTRVRVDPPTHGYRTYLAFAGGIRAERFLDSVSPLPASGFLNAVEAGDVLALGTERVRPPVASGAASVARPFVARMLGADRIGVLETSQTAMFAGMDRLYSHEFVMSGHSNAVGARFDGETPVRFDDRELMSRSVPIGSIEIPSAGELIALLRGRLITAGYPVPAVIAKTDIDVVAQLEPGAVVRFEHIDEQEARDRLMRQEVALRGLAAGVPSARPGRTTSTRNGRTP